MRIEINKFYCNVKGQTVQPGTYHADELPGGLAEYLVVNGHAELIEGDAPQTSPNTGVSVDLESMTKAELIAFASENGIQINASDLKADILAAVKDALGE